MRSTPLRAPPSRGLVLAMLLIVYTFNVLDRQMLGILAQPIKADLGLSDAQFGAIGGLAFASLYSVLGVPLALLADTTTRSWVIAGTRPVWTGCTALFGFATSIWPFFLLRIGRGLGGEGGGATCHHDIGAGC